MASLPGRGRIFSLAASVLWSMNLAFTSTSSTVAALAKGVSFAARPKIFLVLTSSYFIFVILGGGTTRRFGLRDSSFLPDCAFSVSFPGCHLPVNAEVSPAHSQIPPPQTSPSCFAFPSKCFSWDFDPLLMTYCWSQIYICKIQLFLAMDLLHSLLELLPVPQTQNV